MSAIDDVADAISAVTDRLREGMAATEAARARNGDALDQAAALGATATIEGLSAVAASLESLAEQVAAAASAAQEVEALARSLTGGG